MAFNITKLTDGIAIQNTIQTFIQKIQNGSVILPDNLQTVQDVEGQPLWPTALIYNQKIVPINYDPDTKTINLAS